VRLPITTQGKLALLQLQTGEKELYALDSWVARRSMQDLPFGSTKPAI